MSEKEKGLRLESGDNPSYDTVPSGSSLDGGTPVAEEEQAVLTPGSKAGRYMILEVLGRGGMGVVYKAYDPELDRQIALKLMSVQKGQSRAEQARDRLLREAQALAKLSHPNVVSAFDVGTIGDEVFVAMELVEGKTLRRWIQEDHPAPRRIVAVMVQAGRGIAAAHRAGIVHRDIKPDNIVVAPDGRARVLDFGLARVADRPGDPDASTPAVVVGQNDTASAAREEPALNRPETLYAGIVGTPGYMAPEQYQGYTLDALSDQYSFCVTLYEALCHHRPHAALTYQELMRKVLSTPPRPPEAKVPPRWRRIMLRGLAVQKDDRYPSMDALLDELAVDPFVVRKRLLIGAIAVVALLLTVLGAMQWQAHKSRKCQGAEQRLAGVWDAPVRGAVRAAFEKTGSPLADATFERVEKLLDARSQAWVAMRTEACEATVVLGEQSERLMDQRMQCLDRRLSEMRALTGVFARRADLELLNKAVQAATDLPPLGECQDAKALAASVPLPTDPGKLERLKVVREQLDLASALHSAGKYAEGLQVIERVQADAKEVRYRPVQAEVWHLTGLLQDRVSRLEEAARSLSRAAWLADYAGMDEIRARAMTRLVFVQGFRLYRFEEARQTARLARAVIRRLGDDDRLLANWYMDYSTLFERQGRYDRSLRYAQRSYQHMVKALGPEHPQVGRALNIMGIEAQLKGEYAESERYYRQAIQIWEKALGPAHPEVAKVYNNLGLIHFEQGEYPAALEQFALTQTIWEASMGAAHPEIARVLNSMGSVLYYRGTLEEAFARFARALQILTEAKVPDNPLAAGAHNGLGWIELDRRRPARALPHFEQVARICGTENCPSDDQQTVFEARFGLARALGEIGKDPARALALAKQARDELRKLKSVQGKQRLREVEAWLKAQAAD